MNVLKIEPEIVYQALSDPLRIRIIRLLANSKDEICLCEFVDSLQEPQYKLSKHIKSLRQAGLLSAQKQGRWVYHRLVFNHPYIELLCSSVVTIPDTSKQFARDMARFNKRLRLRTEGRCQTGIQTSAFIDGLSSKGTSTQTTNQASH